jgi:predicted PurR-regulated permease PerM
MPAFHRRLSIMADQAALDRSFARRVLIVVGVALLAVIFAYLLRRVGYVLLLGFAGMLLAVGLDGLIKLVQRYTPLTRGWSLLFVVVTLIALMGAIGTLLGPYMVDQMTQLAQRLPEAVDNVRNKLQTYEWGRMLLRSIPAPRELLSGAASMMGQIAGYFSTALGAIDNVFLIIIIGIYMAQHPDLYTKAAIYLVPPKRRERAHAVITALGQALRRWFAGRMASMALIGVLTYIGLSLIGVPLSLALGLVTGILCFVPYLGPVLALIPILLVALLESPILALYALPVYAVIQFAESYLITPIIEQRAVSIPPAYLIIVQVLGGVLAGVIGVVLSEPLAVVVAVIVQMLYIEDALGDSVRVMGEGSADASASSQAEEISDQAGHRNAQRL